MKINKDKLKSLVCSSWFVPVLASVALHLVFFGINLKNGVENFLSKAPVAQKSKMIKIVYLDKKTVLEKNQIVNTEQTGKNDLEKESRFLGKTTQSFDRETISRKVGEFQEASKGKQGSAELAEKVVKNEVFKEKIKKMSLNDLSLHKSYEELLTKSTAAKLASLGTIGGVSAKASSGQSNDYIDDVPLGDLTRVNTNEYRFFGFYDRIRKKLEQFWGSTLKEKAGELYKTGRRLPASVDRITSLKVTIDKEGNIVDIAIKGTSGVAELDEAAVESFNKAGPFPNPPVELVKNGQVDIEWGFVVKS